VNFTRRQRAMGERLPRGYGVAWSRWDIDADVCFPIPFNWLARWARNLYYMVAVPRRKNYLERLEDHLYAEHSRARADMWGRYEQEVVRRAMTYVKWFHLKGRSELAQRIKEVRTASREQ
jgi:hypothetical protein